MVKISVIVPVYKVEKYLDCCVQSILDQTVSDFELILVDDGSPDQCGAMCDAWAQKDGRIRVVHKHNGGLSDARNAGLDVMTGQYVCFADSDDALHPQYLQVLLALLEHTGADIAACHYDFFQEENDWFAETVDIDEELQKYQQSSSEEILANFSNHCRRVSLISQCMKLYKKEIFQDLRMEVGRVQEDSLALPHVLLRTNKMVKTASKLYHWRVTPGSISRSGFNRQEFDRIHVTRRWIEFFEARKDSVQIAYFRREFCHQVLKYYYLTQEKAPELKAYLKPYLRLYRRRIFCYIWTKGLCLRERVAYMLFLLSPNAARRLYMQVYGERYREGTW